MRLSELLGADAATEDGAELGRVHDLRLLLDERPGSPTLTVEGVIVGAGAVGARLGYAHGVVTGPWLVAAVLRRVGRSARYVPWERVVTYDGGRVVVSGSPDDLPHPGDVGGGEP